jgi:hypothetical protein
MVTGLYWGGGLCTYHEGLEQSLLEGNLGQGAVAVALGVAAVVRPVQAELLAVVEQDLEALRRRERCVLVGEVVRVRNLQLR